LKAGASSDCEDLADVLRGPAALLEACKRGNVQRLNRLLDSSNVDVQDPTGRHSSLLHLAAGYNHLKVAELLLKHGARAQTRDKGGLVPLHNAASYGVSLSFFSVSSFTVIRFLSNK
jgi:tankyrase